MNEGGNVLAHDVAASPHARALPGERAVGLHGILRLGALLVAFGVFIQEFPPQPPVADATVVPVKEEIVLPTLHIRAPLVRAASWEDDDVRDLLHRGVVLLPTGDWRPARHRVVTAHSSGGVLSGVYRYVFATIHRLRPGDPITLIVDGREERYVVRDLRVVSPAAVKDLPEGDEGTLTLVSCWPLGSNAYRTLVVAGRAEE